MRKHVLIVCNGFPTPQAPDFTPWIADIGKALAEAGAEVSWLVPFRGEQTLVQKVVKYLEFWGHVIRSSASMCKKADVVYIHMYPYVFPVRLSLYGARSVWFHWHGDELWGERRVFHRVLSVIARLTLPDRAVHIVPSEYFRNILLALVSGLGEDNIRVIPNGGIDTEVFKPFGQAAPSEKDFFTVGFASPCTPEKGFDFFLRLAREKNRIEEAVGKRVKFRCIRYRLDKSLERALNELAGAGVVVVEGPCPHEAMPYFYNKLDVLVFPTVRESLGMVPLEAMACGVPVVAPLAFACSEYIKPGVSGEMYALGDYESFVKSVVRVLSRLNFYNPRKIVEEKYSKQVIVAHYKELLASLSCFT